MSKFPFFEMGFKIRKIKIGLNWAQKDISLLDPDIEVIYLVALTTVQCTHVMTLRYALWRCQYCLTPGWYVFIERESVLIIFFFITAIPRKKSHSK